MLKKKPKPNKDYTGDECFSCFWGIESGRTQKQIDEDHSNCHDWTHCGQECCGECSVCGL